MNKNLYYNGFDKLKSHNWLKYKESKKWSVSLILRIGDCEVKNTSQGRKIILEYNNIII